MLSLDGLRSNLCPGAQSNIGVVTVYEGYLSNQPLACQWSSTTAKPKPKLAAYGGTGSATVPLGRLSRDPHLEQVASLPWTT